MKIAHIEETGKIVGWYDKDIHTQIPTPNVEVSNEIWQEAININANFYDGKSFIVKDFRAPEELEAQRIFSIKSEAGKIITQRYSLVWQLNHPRPSTQHEADYEWIDNIREQSNQLEQDVMKTKDDFVL